MDKTTDIRCWLYDVSELYDEETYAVAMRHVTWQDRRMRIGRYRFAKDRCLSLGAGLLAEHALRKAGASDLSLGVGAYGKPYLQRCPGMHFNLSHSGTMAVCAVASEPVGVDVEERHAYDEGVASLCFAEAERRWIADQPDADVAFTRMWVRKESYLKLRGTGLTDELRSLDVSPASEEMLGVSFWECGQGGYEVCVCCYGDVNVTLERAAPRFWEDANKTSTAADGT